MDYAPFGDQVPIRNNGRIVVRISYANELAWRFVVMLMLRQLEVRLLISTGTSLLAWSIGISCDALDAKPLDYANYEGHTVRKNSPSLRLPNIGNTKYLQCM